MEYWAQLQGYLLSVFLEQAKCSLHLPAQNRCILWPHLNLYLSLEELPLTPETRTWGRADAQIEEWSPIVLKRDSGVGSAYRQSYGVLGWVVLPTDSWSGCAVSWNFSKR